MRHLDAVGRWLQGAFSIESWYWIARAHCNGSSMPTLAGAPPEKRPVDDEANCPVSPDREPGTD